MSLYESVFHQDPRLKRVRSTPRTVVAVGLAVLAAAVLAWLLLNFDSVLAGARSAGDQSITVRREFENRLAPFAGVVVCVVVIVAALVSAVRGCRDWVRTETGNRLRRKVRVAFHGDQSTVDDVHRRFATGDPGVYTPIPPTSQKAPITLEVWLVPEDGYGYVGITNGTSAKTAYRAGIMQFSNRPYEALVAAVDNGLEQPLPDDRNPMRRPAAETTP